MTDPLAGSPWSRPETVAGFTASPPNADLLHWAALEIGRATGRVALDIGCGAGRNAVPLANQGWTVVGTDLSMPMLRAAAARAIERPRTRLYTLLAPMHRLPLRDR